MIKGLLIAVLISVGSANAGESKILTYQDTQDRLFGANLNQTKIYRQLDCAQSMTALVANFFEGAVVEVISAGKKHTLDQSSLQFCGIDDLDQGSYNLDRNLTLCADVVTAEGERWSVSIFAKTHGDMFCENEELISVEGIWVH